MFCAHGLTKNLNSLSQGSLIQSWIHKKVELSDKVDILPFKGHKSSASMQLILCPSLFAIATGPYSFPSFEGSPIGVYKPNQPVSPANQNEPYNSGQTISSYKPVQPITTVSPATATQGIPPFTPQNSAAGPTSNTAYATPNIGTIPASNTNFGFPSFGTSLQPSNANVSPTSATKSPYLLGMGSVSPTNTNGNSYNRGSNSYSLGSNNGNSSPTNGTLIPYSPPYSPYGGNNAANLNNNSPYGLFHGLSSSSGHLAPFLTILFLFFQ